MTCDFCGEDKPREKSYLSAGFDGFAFNPVTRQVDPSRRIKVEPGPWAACLECARFVDVGDPGGLIEYIADRFVATGRAAASDRPRAVRTLTGIIGAFGVSRREPSRN